MNKLLRFFFVRRPETKNKWWHRLALVLIYGSVIVGAILGAIILISEEGEFWVSESYTAYSFEQGYDTAKGKEISCIPLTMGSNAVLRCGNLTSSQFLDKYSQAIGTYDDLEETRAQRSFSDLSEIDPERSFSAERARIYAEEKAEGKKSITEVNTDIMTELIKSGDLDNIKVKRALSFDYTAFFGNWGVYFLLLFSWIIFWETIVYRTILFIIYGRSRKS